MTCTSCMSSWTQTCTRSSAHHSPSQTSTFSTSSTRCRGGGKGGWCRHPHINAPKKQLHAVSGDAGSCGGSPTLGRHSKNKGYVCPQHVSEAEHIRAVPWAGADGVGILMWQIVWNWVLCHVWWSLPMLFASSTRGWPAWTAAGGARCNAMTFMARGVCMIRGRSST